MARRSSERLYQASWMLNGANPPAQHERQINSYRSHLLTCRKPCKGHADHDMAAGRLDHPYHCTSEDMDRFSSCKLHVRIESGQQQHDCHNVALVHDDKAIMPDAKGHHNSEQIDWPMQSLRTHFLRTPFYR